MSASPTRRYRHKKTNLVVEVVGYAKATLAGRFTTVYEVVWPNGQRDAIQASTFHKQFEKEPANE